MTFICTKASRISFIYCLGASGLQVKSVWDKELGINHLKFEELLYSLGFTELLCNGEKCCLYMSIYYFLNSFDCLFCRRVGKNSFFTKLNIRILIRTCLFCENNTGF